jgi:hypothetical protein
MLGMDWSVIQFTAGVANWRKNHSLLMHNLR